MDSSISRIKFSLSVKKNLQEIEFTEKNTNNKSK